MAEGYYKRDHLPHFGDIAEGSGELAKKFFDYYDAVFVLFVMKGAVPFKQ